MYVTEFNNKVKNELSWIFTEYKEVEVQNEVIARQFLHFVANKLNYDVCDIELCNASKNPVNHFQMNMYLDNGFILWGFMIIVKNKKVVASETNLTLLNENYDTIKVICKRK